ncbi:uncharacterized protein Z518_10107 [Rhinocladiella mackenziei CBS 650.93]|uniref:Clr5 domain-containing protein n=1 Tax=Rhinocladiella mackenziei CBS 650.93 TaxID=1442369 RepID=A0A0D2ICT6_9EURO|nr:uncharacterized protein Z518_10107 [Rhinocladiella mackenziei CBS 650.93]KIX01041.1 hypothetical protein Z518_10107 [Rhinocladiella mackenziei CBS 650.93]
MASARPILRSDPFIREDPTTSRYNQRIPKEVWEEIKPRLLMLFNRGIPASDILRELESIDVHVTRSQLATQMRKWGFHKHSREPLQQPILESQDTSTSNDPYSEELLCNARTAARLSHALRQYQDIDSDFPSVMIDTELEMLSIERGGPQFSDCTDLALVSGLNLDDPSVETYENATVYRSQSHGPPLKLGAVALAKGEATLSPQNVSASADIPQQSDNLRGMLQTQRRHLSAHDAIEVLYGPPIAKSCTSSTSSGFMSFKEISTRFRDTVTASALSLYSVSSGKRSERMNWRFSTVTGLPSDSSVANGTAGDNMIIDIKEQVEDM